MAKIQPSVLNLEFTLDENTFGYIDISQAASACSRRFYRQGLVWVVGGFTLQSQMVAPNSGIVTISKIPSTWCASNAWHKTYAAWKKQQDDAIGEAGLRSTIAKYRDFKIHADVDHATATFGANLVPIDLAGVPFQLGEWEHSEIVIPNFGGVAGNTQMYSLHMVGDDANPPASFAMIENYANSRATPQSPDPAIQTPQASFYSEMLDLGEIQDEVVDFATSYNDDLPYSQDNYPGGATNAPELERVHRTTMIPGVGTTSRQLSGTTVPCGLLKIDNLLNPVSLKCILHLVPGSNRGYMTQPMQDM